MMARLNRAKKTPNLECFAFNFLTEGKQLKLLWVQWEPLHLPVFNHLHQLGRQKHQSAALIQEATDGCRFPPL